MNNNQQNRSLVRNNTTLLAVGEVVRANAAASGTQVVRSQADVTANLQGTIGVVSRGQGRPGTYNFQVVTAGEADVLGVGGLALAIGETLYVSAATAGRVTNVAPANAMAIGVVVGTSKYASLGLIRAVLFPISTVPGGAGAGAPSFLMFAGRVPFAEEQDTWIVFNDEPVITTAALKGLTSWDGYPMPVACRVRNLRVHIFANGTVANATNYKIQKNGADSGLQVLTVAPGATGDFADTVNVISFAAADLISLVATGNEGDPAKNVVLSAAVEIISP